MWRRARKKRTPVQRIGRRPAREGTTDIAPGRAEGHLDPFLAILQHQAPLRDRHGPITRRESLMISRDIGQTGWIIRHGYFLHRAPLQGHAEVARRIEIASRRGRDGQPGHFLRARGMPEDRKGGSPPPERRRQKTVETTGRGFPWGGWK